MKVDRSAMGLRAVRWTAVVLGAAVLAWQGVNAARGRFVHDYLVPDLLLGLGLIVSGLWRTPARAAVGMLASFSALGGVFLAASAARLTSGGYDLGVGLATLGLVPCAVASLAIGRRLVASASRADCGEQEPRVSGF